VCDEGATNGESMRKWCRLFEEGRKLFDRPYTRNIGTF